MTINDFKAQLALPVIVAPMFLVSGTKLVIEACKNGIAGTFPSLNGRTPEAFEQMLMEITTELQKHHETTGIKPAPFGVNIIVNKTNQRAITDLNLCKKYKVPLVITSLGAVKDVVNTIHDYGGLVFHDVIKKRHAEKAAESGVDGIVTVAAGAGGHAGTANPFALIKEIKSIYNGAIILAGAIASGGDVVAAESMGADFAYMGTKFIATEESLASNEYKQLVIKSQIEDIVYTDYVTGVNANFIKQTIEKNDPNILEQKEHAEILATNKSSKAWKDVWSAGHGVTGINHIVKTSELINTLKQEYKVTLEKNVERLKKINLS